MKFSPNEETLNNGTNLNKIEGPGVDLLNNNRKENAIENRGIYSHMLRSDSRELNTFKRENNRSELKSEKYIIFSIN